MHDVRLASFTEEHDVRLASFTEVLDVRLASFAEVGQPYGAATMVPALSTTSSAEGDGLSSDRVAADQDLSEQEDLRQEQRYVTALYERLDEMRATAARRLAETLRERGNTHQALSQRDSTAAMYARTVAELDGVESGLCFGRLDFHDASRQYLGRVGLFADDEEHEPLLIDWRAPAARPFYLATAASPLGVDRRRHLRTRGRTVVGVDDEVLDLTRAARVGPTADLTSESALLAAVNAGRTGHMRDIVATIQAEQDHIIRADPAGVLVVQGGPGTGKTAVALHRVAYLLYTYRQQLATRGVLIVGPNRTFLRYISHVLPSLAETGVLLRTLGDLFPGVRATRTEPARVAEIKGRPAMVDVLARAVRDRQRVPDQAGVELAVELAGGKELLVLRRGDAEDARAAARRSGRPHNGARTVFARHLVEAVTKQVAEAIGTDPYADDPLGGDDAPGDPMLLAAADLADIRAEISGDPAVQAVLDDLWPRLTPTQLLADLFADPAAIASAAPDLTDDERRLLVREPGGWTAADVPLLDEAVELLGEDPDADLQRREAERMRREAYAQGALDIVEGSRTLEFEDEDEPEVLLASDLLDAATLAERQRIAEQVTTAQRAAADRAWAFGHVIVDEAQELSPMAWRLLMRRSPSRSMTVVGDIAQTGDLAGAASWESVFAPYVADRWRLAELTVNYRTPAEIMDLAGTVLASIDPALRPPASVRSTGEPPRVVTTAPGRSGGDVAATAAQVVRDEAAQLGDGRLGVIVPDTALAEVAASVRSVEPSATVGSDPDLTASVAVLTVRQAKGLEFDVVIVVDPEEITTGSPRGRSDLYVALTRATRRLILVTAAPWP
jgi:DNA helicase IV